MFLDDTWFFDNHSLASVIELKSVRWSLHRPRQIVLPNWREDLNGHCIFQGNRAVLNSTGNAPAVASLGIVFIGADRQAHTPTDQITGLLVRVRMPGQNSATGFHLDAPVG